MLPFLAGKKRTAFPTFLLDGLDVSPPDTSHPERQSLLAQFQPIGVKIHRDQGAGLTRSVRGAPQQRTLRQASKRMRGCFKLELNLMRRGRHGKILNATNDPPCAIFPGLETVPQFENVTI